MSTSHFYMAAASAGPYDTTSVLRENKSGDQNPELTEIATSMCWH
jgi:hypothetical protein